LGQFTESTISAAKVKL